MDTYGRIEVDPNDPGFVTEFPSHEFGKNDYKRIAVHNTYGNDKLISQKGFRPSHGMSEGEDVQVLAIPLKTIEGLIKKLANSGPNQEKMTFFKQFEWYDYFTQSLKTKFNGCIEKKVFYPGAKIVNETKNDKKVYIIVQGTAKLECQRAGLKFSALASGANQASVNQLINNGYTSSTLRSIQLGILQNNEWIGEDLLIKEDPSSNHEYTATAVTKCVTFQMSFADLYKIP